METEKKKKKGWWEGDSQTSDCYCWKKNESLKTAGFLPLSVAPGRILLPITACATHLWPSAGRGYTEQGHRYTSLV